MSGALRLVAFLVALAAPLVAFAEPTLESAKAALDGSDYPGARQQLTAVLENGRHDASELAEIYKLLGIAAAALNDTSAATDAFAHGLALDPKLELPKGTSPRITKPFTAAKGKVKAKLEIKAETKSDPPAVVIATVNDPVEMIARYQVTVRVDGTVRPQIEKPAAEEMEIAVPSGARIDVWVAALDKHGNRIAAVGSSEVPLVIVGKSRGDDVTPPPPVDDKKKPDKQKPEPHVVKVEHPRPLYLQWWLWGGATLVAAGATSYFGVQAINGRDALQEMTGQTPKWDVFQDKIASTKRDVLITNIGFGVTGALGLTAAILFVTRPHSSLGPMQVDHGAGVAMRGSF
ncbi:MAG TPA: hypothetical protein VL326_09335 [Kofleriaceae bacterium]|nr:hypothetical protein [Kofleriaceae bacterium]